MSFEVFMQVLCLQKSKLWWSTQGKPKTGENRGEKPSTTPFWKLLGPFRLLPEVHFLILYTVSKIGKSGVQRFKRCPNRSWNEKVMVIARKLDRAEREFRTPQSKVRKISHRAKHPSSTRVEFHTSQANFRTVQNKVQKFRTPQFKVRNSF